MKIAFLDYETLNFDGLDISCLEELGEVQLFANTAPEETIAKSQGCEIIISNKVILDRKVINALPDLKFIVVAATGYNNIDILAANEKGIKVSNVRNYSTEGVVQHTFALVLSLLNRVKYYNDQVDIGRWQNSNSFAFYDHSIRELSGKTFGIYGYGNIGQRVGQVASAFGMKTMAFVRSPENYIHPSIKLVDLDTLLKTSDILSLHAPLNKESHHVINSSSISLMKQDCLLINTARGGLVDDSALAKALKDRKLAGAAIDTLDQEPPKNSNPLFGLENCLVTPHIAWASYESRVRLINGIIANVKAYQNGRLINLVG